MPRFTYSARDRAGASTAGEIDAPSRRDALRLLAARGLAVSRVEEMAVRSGRGATGTPSSRPATSRVLGAGAAAPGRRERLPFLVALEDLTSSGLSAGEAAFKAAWLMREALARRLTGVALKEESGNWLARDAMVQVTIARDDAG